MPIAVSGSNIVFADGSSIASGFTGFKNRIINGAMVIDQRNAGASVSATNGGYTLDRYNSTSYASPSAATNKFTVQQNAGSVTPPPGFTNYLGVTSSAATTVNTGDVYTINQAIEGFNIADLAWGTANAKTVTLSFWVRSSLTGTFGGAINNNDGNYNYPYTYTISSANTWEYKTITISGPTAGTWLTNNGIGIYVKFGLGAGTFWTEPAGAWSTSFAYSADSSVNVVSTNGATWYITGVQLEAGSSATSFEYRDYGNELRMCQRYLPVWYGGGDQIVTMYNSDTGILGSFKTPVPVRSTVTGLTFSTNANSIFSAYDGFKGGYTPTNAGLNNGGINYVTIQCNSTGLVAGRAGLLRVADSQWMYGTGCEL